MICQGRTPAGIEQGTTSGTQALGNPRKRGVKQELPSPPSHDADEYTPTEEEPREEPEVDCNESSSPEPHREASAASTVKTPRHGLRAKGLARKANQRKKRSG